MGPGFQPERFTGAIALALLEAEPRLELNVPFFPPERMDPETWQTQGGASAEGLMDDFFVVEAKDTGRFKVVDFQDSYTVTWSLSQSDLFQGAAIMMFHPPSVLERYGSKSHLIKPGWFLDQTPSFVQGYREEVAEIRKGPLDDRLFFRGTIHGETPDKIYLRGGKSVREVGLVLREKYPDEVDISGHKLPRPEWFREAARHQLVLTLPGHPWCYREFEMMSLGIPILTYRWTSYLYHQPVHYIPVEEVKQDPIGFAADPEEGADAIIKKFREVRHNLPLFEATARQAQRWYDTYLSPAQIAKDMLTFLDLDSL